MNETRWVHLKDPTDSELVGHLPANLHEIADQRLRRTREFDDDVFARLESHDHYLFGEFAYPVYDIEADEVGTVGIRVVIDFEHFLTVSRTPNGIPDGVRVPDVSEFQAKAGSPDLGPGDFVWILTVNIAETIHTMLDTAYDRTESLEESLNDENRPDFSATNCRQQIAVLRNMYLQLGIIAEPTLSLVEKIIDDELDLWETVDGETRELFPRYTEIRMIDVQESLRHAQQRCDHGQDMMRTLVDNLSGYLDREQTRAGNRLTSVASIMLLPTFIVGLYGMNIDKTYFPEFGWLNGYLLAWLVIALITLIQIIVFKKMGWLFKKKQPTVRD